MNTKNVVVTRLEIKKNWATKSVGFALNVVNASRMLFQFCMGHERGAERERSFPQFTLWRVI